MSDGLARIIASYMSVDALFHNLPFQNTIALPGKCTARYCTSHHCQRFSEHGGVASGRGQRLRHKCTTCKLDRGGKGDLAIILAVILCQHPLDNVTFAAAAAADSKIRDEGQCQADHVTIAPAPSLVRASARRKSFQAQILFSIFIPSQGGRRGGSGWGGVALAG